MSPVSRRILIYWLLLLLPTCAVGIGAIQLLRREQARLAEQEDYASEARRAAITARAGLIVENVELLVGDVQNGLLDSLAALPADNLDAALTEWSRANSLVRVAFHARTDGTLLHAAAAGDANEAAGFRRRIGSAWRTSPPWRRAANEADVVQLDAFGVSAAAADESSARREKEEQAARARASANVSKVQSARRDAQQLARVSEKPAGAAAVSMLRDAPAATAELEQKRVAPNAEKQRGWTPWQHDGRTHVFGWIERTNDVVGLELELSALISRLAAALPEETGAGEGFALVDERGRVMHQIGFVPREGTSMSAIPVSSSALRGWEVATYYVPSTRTSGGATFFLLGSLLVGILLIAILAGGSLLFWQARRSEAEAAQKTSFVANVSHEFKTPLTTIRLYAELLENGRVPDADRRSEYLRTIGRETQRLARLVGNALDFSRLEQGRKKFARERLDLRAEVSRLAETHAMRLEEQGLAVKTELPDTPLGVATDRDAFEQIVVNLLDNAAKYGASGGEVTLRLEPLREGGREGARLCVLDRGPGVPAEHRERIFEKFHRVDDTLTAEHGGAGLGLSIARQLARGLGGELRYEPREDGGANFILELP